jgi:NitT/TauT family transport system substrate-binding protein
MEEAMLDRRQILKSGVAVMGCAAAHGVRAQTKLPMKVRYNEVTRALSFGLTYVAISKGFFKDVGLDVVVVTGNGGDKSMAALIGGVADIAAMGTEEAIYVLNSESPEKVRIFSGLLATCGHFLVARENVDSFDWGMLKGKTILGWRPGSTPLLFLEAALRLNGINPLTDVKLVNNIAIPARSGAWIAGQGQYGIFSEPDASQLQLDGNAHIVASVGQTVGQIDFNTYMATDRYLKEHSPEVQAWTDAIAKAMTWTASAPTPDVVAALMPFFPGIGEAALTEGTNRYRRLRVWKTSPVIAPAAVERFQDILVQGGVLEANKRLKFADLVVTEFSSKAT